MQRPVIPPQGSLLLLVGADEEVCAELLPPRLLPLKLAPLPETPRDEPPCRMLLDWLTPTELVEPLDGPTLLDCLPLDACDVELPAADVADAADDDEAARELLESGRELEPGSVLALLAEEDPAWDVPLLELAPVPAVSHTPLVLHVWPAGQSSSPLQRTVTAEHDATKDATDPNAINTKAFCVRMNVHATWFSSWNPC